MERTIGLLSDCMPQDARDFYVYIYKYIENPDSVKNEQQAFSRYDQLAAECILNGTMIKMDFTTGQIESTNSVSSNCTIIRTDDFEQSVTLMPHSMKCVLNDLINQMVAFGTDMQLTDKDKAAFQNLGLLVSKTIYIHVPCSSRWRAGIPET